MKIIANVVKKIIFAICVIYLFNMVGAGLKIFIPINFITIGVVSLLGMSGLMSLIAIFFVLI